MSNIEKLTKETLAAMLNGREYGEEITREEIAAAKAAGLVVAFGYSDDNMELRGAIHDEVGCFDGRTFDIDREGVMLEWEAGTTKGYDEAKAYFLRENNPTKVLRIVWHDSGDPCWTFSTEIPHATFKIMEGEEVFCVGIVFSLEDIK